MLDARRLVITQCLWRQFDPKGAWFFFFCWRCGKVVTFLLSFLNTRARVFRIRVVLQLERLDLLAFVHRGFKLSFRLTAMAFNELRTLFVSIAAVTREMHHRWILTRRYQHSPYAMRRICLFPCICCICSLHRRSRNLINSVRLMLCLEIAVRI